MNRRVAIVTGVSRLNGIGRAICVELAKRNINIFFTYWKEYDNQMPWKAEANEEAEWITGQIIHSEGGFIR